MDDERRNERFVVRRNRIFAVKGIFFSLIMLFGSVFALCERGGDLNDRIAHYLSYLMVLPSSVLLFLWIRNLISPEKMTLYELDRYALKPKDEPPSYVLQPDDEDISHYEEEDKREAIERYKREHIGLDAIVDCNGDVYCGLIEEVDEWDVTFSCISSVKYGKNSDSRVYIPLDDIVALIA